MDKTTPRTRETGREAWKVLWLRGPDLEDALERCSEALRAGVDLAPGLHGGPAVRRRQSGAKTLANVASSRKVSRSLGLCISAGSENDPAEMRRFGKVKSEAGKRDGRLGFFPIPVFCTGRFLIRGKDGEPATPTHVQTRPAAERLRRPQGHKTTLRKCADRFKLKFNQAQSEFSFASQARSVILGFRLLSTSGSAGSTQGRAVAWRWGW